MYRGYSLNNDCWIYGMLFQRTINGKKQCFIVPDDDNSLRVFLFNKVEFEVDTASIGRYCSFLNAYEGDLYKLNNKIIGFLQWFEDFSEFYIVSLNEQERFHINLNNIIKTDNNIYQKEKITKKFESLHTNSVSLCGTEYGRMLFQKKITNLEYQHLVKTSIFFDKLDEAIHMDKESLLSEFTLEDEPHIASKIKVQGIALSELLPYLQAYVCEQAVSQGVIYQPKDFNALELYSYDFMVNNRYYNISTVLGIDTETSVYKYKKKPQGKIIILEKAREGVTVGR